MDQQGGLWKSQHEWISPNIQKYKRKESLFIKDVNINIIYFYIDVALSGMNGSAGDVRFVKISIGMNISKYLYQKYKRMNVYLVQFNQQIEYLSWKFYK